MTFEKLSSDNSEKIELMSKIATEIVRKHYDPILGKAQNDYMLEKFQSPQAIKDQLEHGYNYYFIVENDRYIGFTAFFPRGDHMYISKLYLYENERGKGYSKEALKFISEETEKLGLRAIELNANKHNPSCDIYKHLGFIIDRAEKNDIGCGYFMDDFVFRLEI